MDGHPKKKSKKNCVVCDSAIHSDGRTQRKDRHQKKIVVLCAMLDT
jgi:hypothetical protein